MTKEREVLEEIECLSLFANATEDAICNVLGVGDVVDGVDKLDCDNDNFTLAVI